MSYIKIRFVFIRIISKCNVQCHQIGRFIILWATFQSPWQQLFCPNWPNVKAISAKVSKSFILLEKYFLGYFYRHLATFTSHTGTASEGSVQCTHSLTPNPILEIYFSLVILNASHDYLWYETDKGNSSTVEAQTFFKPVSCFIRCQRKWFVIRETCKLILIC